MKIISLAIIVTFLAAETARPATLFFDDFDGTSLDLTKWGDIHSQGTIEVSGGVLRTFGGGDHHHMTSTTAFDLIQGLVVSARFRISDLSVNGGAAYDYHQFGLSYSHTAATPPSWEGYLIGSYDDRDGENYNTVHWIGVSNPGGTEFSRGIAPVSWNDFHVFTLIREASGIRYKIDGVDVGFTATTFSGPVPVYIGGDRAGLFEVDWVQVDQIPEPATCGITAFVLLIMCGFLHRRSARLQQKD